MWQLEIFKLHLFSSVAQSHPTLCDPMDCSTPGLPIYHQLPEFTQIHVHQVGDVIQPSHPLLSPSPPALNLSQHQGLFQWVSSLHQVAKVLGASASAWVLQNLNIQLPITFVAHTVFLLDRAGLKYILSLSSEDLMIRIVNIYQY